MHPSLRPRLAAAVLALAMGAAQGEPLRYRLDPARSFVHVEVLHFGTSTIRGRFGPVDGVVTLDRAAGSGELGLRIRTDSISTGLALFDTRLRQPDLLATEAWPEAFFVATQFRHEGSRLAEVRGEFTFRGVGRPLSLQAQRFACRSDDATATQPAREVCGGDFEAEIRRSEFGATFGLPLVGDRVRLLVRVEGVRESDVGAAPQGQRASACEVGADLVRPSGFGFDGERGAGCVAPVPGLAIRLPDPRHTLSTR